MTKDFIVRPKYTDKKEDKSITMTIRLERELQEEYDKLSAKSGRSRNELMCMALRYALENLKFVENFRVIGYPELNPGDLPDLSKITISSTCLRI